ncbi:MAG: hypothetical protein HOP23_17040 [Methylococcaceae bacterium]|nr:hypothetical protein [Methylococcaceae bacterium]
MLNENLMESLLTGDNLRAAYKRVKANKGSPGVDGMTVDAFAGHAQKHWPTVVEKLKTGAYRPGVIRGVSIPKPQGGERRLGIPNVQDRVIQQAVAQVLSPIFEPEFSRIAPAEASLDRLKDQVRSQWNAQESIALEDRIKRWQDYNLGWWNYFSICQQRRGIKMLEGWIRRHMRKYANTSGNAGIIGAAD